MRVCDLICIPSTSILCSIMLSYAISILQYGRWRYLHVSSQQNIMVPNSCDNSCFHCAPPLMLTWFVHMRRYRTMESTNSIKFIHAAFTLACKNPLNHCLTKSLPINECLPIAHSCNNQLKPLHHFAAQLGAFAR